MASQSNAKAKRSSDSVVALVRRGADETVIPGPGATASHDAEFDQAARDHVAEAQPSQPEELKPAPQPVAPPRAPVAPQAAPAAAPAKRKRSFGRTFVLPLLLIAALAGAGWYGYNYWIDGRFMISTDDAYVQADISYVTPKISGYVKEINAAENQAVKAGDPIITIDDGDYAIARDQAAAQIAVQGKTLARIEAQIAAAQAALGQSKAQETSAAAAANNAQRTVDRLSQLVKSRVATQAQLDDAQTGLDQAKAALAGAQAASNSP